MSERTIEIAKRGFTAWREGDLETVESILHRAFSGARMSRAIGIATAETT
jgi:hypothetical protein